MIFGKSLALNEKEIGAVAGDSPVDSSMAEKQFVERLRSGDNAAFDTLVTRFAPDIYGLLLRIMKDPEEASDLTQETFLRALKAMPGFRGDSSLKTWLFRIAINQSRNRFRWWKRRKRERTYSLDAPLGNTSLTVSETIASRSLNPEEDALRLERERILLSAISDLRPIFREAVVLCDIQGFSYEEIAGVLNINLGTVKSRISRGREELRRKLKGI